MEFIQITDKEKALLNKIEPSYKKFIELKPQEEEFLFALASRSKATKALELGISSGASSALLGHVFLQEEDSIPFYSIDYCEDWYINNAHKTGFVMNVYPNINNRWALCTGGLAAHFLNTIGDEIDFVFLDTSHEMPCEILDFLMILPYLSENCMLVVHDANLQTAHPLKPLYTVNNTLLSAISGDKICPHYVQDFFAKHKDGSYFNSSRLSINEGGRLIDKALIQEEARHALFTFPNIAAVRLNQSTRDNVWNLFNALAQNWQYIPNDDDFNTLSTHFRKFYKPYYCDMFEASYHLAKYSHNIREVLGTDEAILKSYN